MPKSEFSPALTITVYQVTWIWTNEQGHTFSDHARFDEIERAAADAEFERRRDDESWHPDARSWVVIMTARAALLSDGGYKWDDANSQEVAKVGDW